MDSPLVNSNENIVLRRKMEYGSSKVIIEKFRGEGFLHRQK